jgi:hypothetical protein
MSLLNNILRGKFHIWNFEQIHHETTGCNRKPQIKIFRRLTQEFGREISRKEA